MASQRFINSPAVRKQNLLVEFSGLRTASPSNVFMSLTPNDPTLWTGVIFVSKGPYASAVLRFQIYFPPKYPTLPPLVTFLTDMFHPLITPLTTQTYTTDIHDSGTVSATDEERLPPGGFSLRHGFPTWFGRKYRSVAGSRQTSSQFTSAQTPLKQADAGGRDTPETGSEMSPQRTDASVANGLGFISVYEILRYIRTTFDDEAVLDSILLEAAGNPGAWHAWRTYRIKKGKIIPSAPKEKIQSDGRESKTNENASDSSVKDSQSLIGGPPPVKNPGEWNWEGVWEVRVKRNIEGSLSEPVLYGNNNASDDLIRFLNVDGEQAEAMKENLARSMEAA